jgi:hypothetical protein
MREQIIIILMRLEEMTGKEWRYDTDIDMFVAVKNPSRRMRLEDAQKQWLMFINDEHAPF